MADPEVLHPLRPFLKNWVWEHGHIHTRYLDCRDGEVKADDGKKARFASEKIFYVSLSKDADDTTHATGAATQEGNLARFLSAAQLGQPEKAGSVADVQRAAQDCIELGLVCAYQQDASLAHARYSQEAMFEDEIRAAVIADIRRAYVGLREQLALYDFTVFHDLPAPLLINESPFIDWRVSVRPAQPFVSLPLGPGSLLVGTPSGKKSRVGPVLWKNVAVMGPFKEHNRILVAATRLWLVATTDEQLIALQSRFAPPSVAKPETNP